MIQSIEEFHITPLSSQEARQILTWRYDPPYDFYNPPEVVDQEDYVNQLIAVENGFHSIRSTQHEFVGFCSYGMDGRVFGGQYDNDCLDIGLGMRPGLTGRGRGAAFFGAIVQYASEHFWFDGGLQSRPDNSKQTLRLRLTVASFNRRAIRIYSQFGFTILDRFDDKISGVSYLIMSYQVPAQTG